MHKQFQQPIDYKKLIEIQAKETKFPNNGKSSFANQKPEGKKGYVKTIGSRKRG